MKKIILCLLLIICCGCAKEKNYSGVVYEIFVGSFADSNNDGIGDLKGIENKLDYLMDELGVNEFWLTPIFQAGSYHKYDVEDYYNIDSDFGTNEDFVSLANKIHEKGGKIYLDLVINHSSSSHPWFKKAIESKLNNTCYEAESYCAYYNFSDYFQNGYASINDNLYYEARFTETMPDLNLDAWQVRYEIQKITKYWLDLGADGFRLDASLHYYEYDNNKNVSFLSWLDEVVKSEKEDAYIVAEVWDNKSTINYYYNSGIDSFFEFPFSSAEGEIATSIKNGSGSTLAQSLVNYINSIKEVDEDASPAFFLSNHDQARSAGYFIDLEKEKLAASIYLLLPGKPYIYYGEELGMRGSGIDENKRMAMLWGKGDDCLSPVNTTYTNQIESSVKQQLSDSESLLSYYQKVLSVRNDFSFIERADISYFDLNDEALFGISLSDENNEIVVVHNFAEEGKTVEIEGKEYIELNNSSCEKGVCEIGVYGSIIIKK